jgi:hypothetical protein
MMSAHSYTEGMEYKKPTPLTKKECSELNSLLDPVPPKERHDFIIKAVAGDNIYTSNDMYKWGQYVQKHKHRDIKSLWKEYNKLNPKEGGK